MIPPITISHLRELTTKSLNQCGEQHAILRAIEQSLVVRGETVGYLPQHFSLNELVPPEILSEYGEQAWQFLDDRLLWSLDALWSHFQPREGQKYAVVVNSYPWGGKNRYRGYRPTSYTEGATNSQHRHGRAADVTVVGYSPADVYAEILHGKDHADFRYITAIKEYPTWVHIDCRNYLSEGILEIS